MVRKAGILGAETRDRILYVAMELAREKGFASMSTREISERLGVTKSALYYHFRSKDDLLFAMVEPLLAGLSELVSGDELQTSADRRRELLSCYINLVASHRSATSLLRFDPAAAGNTNVAETSDRLYELLTQQLCGQADPCTADFTRAWSALGGIHLALWSMRAGDDQAVVCTAALAAACGALGIAAASESALSPAAV